MSVIELSELRHFWHERCPAGHKLMRIIQRLVDRCDLSVAERMELGVALQEFSDELLMVHTRLEKRP